VARTLIDDLLRLRARHQQVILVSSGAIALGRRHLKLAKGALSMRSEAGPLQRRPDSLHMPTKHLGEFEVPASQGDGTDDTRMTC